jgi:hypothetical protein
VTTVPALVSDTPDTGRMSDADARPPGGIARITAVPPGAVAVLVLFAAAAYRAIVIASHHEPSGVDFGNWLMLGHQLLGHPLRGAASVVYPPLVPFLAVVFTHIFGVVWADAILAGLAGIAPALGMYVTARLGGARWAAVVAAALLAFTSSTGEAAAWGGLPQLIGFGFGIASLGFAARLAVTRTLRSALSLGLVLLAVAATSHLVLAQVGVAVVFVILVQVARAPKSFGPRCWLGRRALAVALALAVVPSLLLTPVYLRLLHTVGQSLVVQNQVSPGWPALQAFSTNLSVVYRDVPWLWKAALLITAATPLLLGQRRHREEPLWLVTTGLVLSFVPQALLSGEPRLVYLVPAAVACAVALWLKQIGSGAVHLGGRRAVTVTAAAIVAAVSVASWFGITFFQTQRAFYGAFVPSGTVAALNWLRDNTPPQSLVAVTPENGAPFGWWVQGYGRRAALVGSEDRWLSFPAERTRAQEAVAMFSTPDPLDAAVMVDARKLHVQYLVIPWSWGGLSDADFTAFRAAQPNAVVFDNRAMLIVKVPS